MMQYGAKTLCPCCAWQRRAEIVTKTRNLSMMGALRGSPKDGFRWSQVGNTRSMEGRQLEGLARGDLWCAMVSNSHFSLWKAVMRLSDILL